MTTRENSLLCNGWVKCVLMLASITSLLIFIKLSLTTSRKFSIAVVAHPVEPVEEAEDWIALSPQEWSSLGTHTIADNIGLWERWIVVYSTQAAPSPWLHELSKQSQWKMVVVADNDEQEPAWLGATCIFLSLEKQDRLGYEITKLLPMHHHSRKNIGYLFAIHHGATAIYDIDHMDNSSLDFLSSHLQPFVQSQILFVSDRDPVAAISNDTSCSGKMVNIYQHFGQGTVWPLGFPVEEISAPLRRAHYDQKSNVNVGVQQNLINGETDVDSIFRLTRKNRGQSLQVYFDTRADFVGLPQFSFCPFSGQNAIINSVAFWSLVIPTSFSNRLASTFRSYWMQRLLWDVGAAVTFGPPTIDRQRNVTNTKQDFDRQEYILEQTFIAKASQLVQFLADWKSDQPFFFNRVDELCHDLAGQGFWSVSDALVCRAWLKDLMRVGFKSPTISKDLAVINYDETLTEWFKPPSTSKGCSNCFVPLELPTTYLHYDTQSSVLVRLKYFLPPEIVLYTITFSGRHKLVKLMKNTWGQLVQNFIVYSSSNDPSVPTIMVKPDNPTWKTSCTNCRQSYLIAPVLRHLAANFDNSSFKLFINIDDDTFPLLDVLATNLEAYQQAHGKYPDLFGHFGRMDGGICSSPSITYDHDREQCNEIFSRQDRIRFPIGNLYGFNQDTLRTLIAGVNNPKCPTFSPGDVAMGGFLACAKGITGLMSLDVFEFGIPLPPKRTRGIDFYSPTDLGFNSSTPLSVWRRYFYYHHLKNTTTVRLAFNYYYQSFLPFLHEIGSKLSPD